MIASRSPKQQRAFHLCLRLCLHLKLVARVIPHVRAVGRAEVRDEPIIRLSAQPGVQLRHRARVVDDRQHAGYGADALATDGRDVLEVVLLAIDDAQYPPRASALGEERRVIVVVLPRRARVGERMGVAAAPRSSPRQGAAPQPVMRA